MRLRLNSVCLVSCHTSPNVVHKQVNPHSSIFYSIYLSLARVIPTPPAAATQLSVASSAVSSANHNRLNLGDAELSGRQLIVFQLRISVAIWNILLTLKDKAASGSSPGNCTTSAAQSFACQDSLWSSFEQPRQKITWISLFYRTLRLFRNSRTSLSVS